jgi:hypothetical protein
MRSSEMSPQLFESSTRLKDKVQSSSIWPILLGIQKDISSIPICKGRYFYLQGIWRGKLSAKSIKFDLGRICDSILTITII